MAYVFSVIPGNIAKFCANKPIHIIIGTALLASLTYLTIVENYVAHFNISADSSDLLHFYHAPGSSNDWIQIDDLSDFASNGAEHLALTPISFKGAEKSDYPLNGQLIFSEDGSQAFLLSDYQNYDEEIEKLDLLTNEAGEVFKPRTANKIGRYYGYIKQHLKKVVSLVKGAEKFDIALITVAYLAMWMSFVQLFYQMQRVGSTFWLAFGTLLSSLFAFLFSIVITTEVLNKKIPLISLTEGLPFLVATIGFKHKVSFTEPIVKALSSRKNQNKDISTVIGEVVTKQTALPLIKEQLLLSLALFLGSFMVPAKTGFGNFCILSSVILAVDLFFTFTFYASILSLKAQISQVHRRIELKEFLEEDGIAESVADAVSLQPSSSLFTAHSTVVSFKVLTILGFLSLHLFVLGTSWLYEETSDYSPSSLISATTKSLHSSIAQKISISELGTIVTVLPVRAYHKIH
ncbi:unnamed protein product [Ambrosiozyma monospora]|uniref:Unnamed protein product n=1 Tax=Ambrosiozyma monospora TaxID=43982 RepID=A0ACB5T9Z5_AMBMO|nr:unnamed protein product [Ambrosiozyma monospora]